MASIASVVERDADVRRQRATGGRDEQPDRLPGGQIVDGFDPARHIDDCRAAEPRLRHPVRASPNQRATEGRRQGEPAERTARAAAAQDKTDQRQRGRYAEERRPLSLRVEREPRRDTAPQPDNDPRGKLAALSLEEPFQLPVKRGKPRLPIAPSPLWKRRFPYVRGARPLHCSKERRGMPAPAQARKI